VQLFNIGPGVIDLYLALIHASLKEGTQRWNICVGREANRWYVVSF
jgi:hypothetical protein